jgi:hypothetical protein
VERSAASGPAQVSKGINIFLRCKLHNIFLSNIDYHYYHCVSSHAQSRAGSFVLLVTESIRGWGGEVQILVISVRARPLLLHSTSGTRALTALSPRAVCVAQESDEAATKTTKKSMCCTVASAAALGVCSAVHQWLAAP